MSVPAVAPDVGAPAVPEKRKARAQKKPGASGGFVFPTIFMLAFLVYFLMPLFWLLVASTKSLDDLFDSFGLWFADFNLIDNIKDTFNQDNGVYVDWLRNTIVYSVVSAVGAALLAASAGYGFAKFAFRGKNLLFWFVLGSVMVPTTALAIPTYLMFAKLGFTNNPLSIILPSLVSPFGIYLMRIYAEASVPSVAWAVGVYLGSGRAVQWPCRGSGVWENGADCYSCVADCPYFIHGAAPQPKAIAPPSRQEQ